MDNGFYIGMVVIDLQKAFDIVDHEILLHKLKALGFHDISVLWLESYLKNRNQKTDINCTFSNSSVAHCGVPQGCILGPSLFLIYVNGSRSILSTHFVCR